MSLTLDHIFILVDAGASEAQLLTEIGLMEGARSDHPGQGTANRRFFFENFFLEFIYLRDAAEARNGPGAGLRFCERQANADLSPFGLVFRTTHASHDEPFSYWKYYPDYFKGQHYFLVGNNSDELLEPLVICMPTTLPEISSSLVPENPELRLTSATISVPVQQPTETLNTTTGCQPLDFRFDQPHHIALAFNEGRGGRSVDFADKLPLSIKW